MAYRRRTSRRRTFSKRRGSKRRTRRLGSYRVSRGGVRL